MATYFHTRFFGLRAFTTVYGVQQALTDVAFGLAPVAVGFVYDRTGSYNIPLFAIVGAALVSAIIYAMLGPYRYAANLGAAPAPAETGPAASPAPTAALAAQHGSRP
ncbi:MAG: hypothetical protein WDM92_07575 [Caulobacteraceae bacterium]